ncbi:MAG: hypothetical protein KAH56_01685 [Candidatus Krumholzibacteria bacterium]|nr:hypothetical protein [Candidatus Krumholzibacteria bacterium]
MSQDKSRPKDSWQEIVWDEHNYNERTVLKSGSFLGCYCPHCSRSLMKDNLLHLVTIDPDGNTGWMQLNPYLNAFERKSNLQLTEGEEVTDLRCWHCQASLRAGERKCDRGDSHVACVLVGISTVRVPFYFCMRTGCHWHLIDPDDEHKIILDDSMEW